MAVFRLEGAVSRSLLPGLKGSDDGRTLSGRDLLPQDRLQQRFNINLSGSE